jgi:thiamine-monophosphate kinase
MKLEELGEFSLIERIRALTGAGGPSLVLGIGDDTAVIRVTPGHLLLATCDSLIEGRHFLRSRMTAEQLGCRLAAVNLSDIGSMGGAPRWALASLALPAETEVAFVEGFYRGLVAELGRFGAVIAGGNLSGGRDLLLDLTLLGEALPEQILRRDGARPGDVILLSGVVGDSAAGRAALDAGLTDPQFADLIAAHLTPEPRVGAGQAIARSGLARAMLDVSDGLAQDLGHICDASNAGARIEVERLPLSAAMRALSERLGLDPLALALGGGEDYELLLTAPEGVAVELAAFVHAETGVRLTAVGRILPLEDGRSLLLPGGRREPLTAQGWQHFGH